MRLERWTESMARPILLGLGKGWREKMMYFPKEKVLFCLGVVQTIVLCVWFYKGFMDWPRTWMTHSNIVSIGKMFWASKIVLQFNLQFYFSPFGDCLDTHTVLVLFCYLCSNCTFSSVYLHGHSWFSTLWYESKVSFHRCSWNVFFSWTDLENVWK